MTSNIILKGAIVSFLIVFISTTFLIGFTNGGSYAYSTVFPPTDLLEKNTRVANISIGEMTIEEAAKVLYEETEGWKGTNAVSFLYKDTIQSNSASSIFHFDIQGSIQFANTNKIAPLLVTINEQNINEMLSELSNDDLVEKVDLELLNNDLQAYARSLKQEDFQVNIHHYILEEQKEQKQVLAEAYITNFTTSALLEKIVNHLDGTDIEPRQTSSLLALVNEELLEHSYEMSVIASGLYTAYLNTNFEMIERHISQSLPEYSELGFEAYVSYPSHDLRVFNPNYIPYTIEVKLHLNYLYVAIVGYPFEKNFSIEKESERSFAPKTVLQFSALVPEGEREIKHPGQFGFSVNVKKKTFNRNNSLLGTELISEDFYRPVHRIEVRSLIISDSSSQSSGDSGNGITNPDSGVEGDSPASNGDRNNGDSGEQLEGKEEDDLEFEYDDSDPIKGY